MYEAEQQEFRSLYRGSTIGTGRSAIVTDASADSARHATTSD